MSGELHTIIAENYFWVTLVLFLVGACIGSFLNVCMYRMPQEGASIVTPGSYCPACKQSIAWYDNIPIASWLALGGKCRQCAAPISPRYLMIEILTGYFFVQYANVWGLSATYLANVYLTCSLLVATLIDFKYQIIPDEINYAGMIVGVLLSTIFPGLQSTDSHLWGLAWSLVGLVTGGGLIYAIGVIGDFVFKRESMGGGDVKLMAMVGAFLGWKGALLTFFIAPFLGAGIGLYVKYVKKEDIIPYGPFLSIAAVVVMFVGERILNLLLGK